MLLVLQLQIQNICPSFPLTTSSSNPISRLGKIIDIAEAKYHYITMNYIILYKIVQSKTNIAIMETRKKEWTAGSVAFPPDVGDIWEYDP